MTSAAGGSTPPSPASSPSPTSPGASTVPPATGSTSATSSPAPARLPGARANAPRAVAERWTWGLSVVAIAVGALLLAFAFTVFGWRDVAGIAALGAVASPIAAVVGAYFGVHMSAVAAKEATQRATKAEEDKARALADVATVLSHLSSEQGPRVRATLNFR